VDNRQYAELFLSESREHVTAINEALIALERGGGEPAASAAIGAIFRAVHTIKGMAATMGYSLVTELAHELESVLDRIRRGQRAVDARLMDVLFRAADVLEQAVESAVSQDDTAAASVDGAPELLDALRALDASLADGAGTNSAATPVTPAASAGVALAAGAPGLAISIRLSREAPLRGVRAFIIVQSLEKLGTVAALHPPLDQLQADSFDGAFALRLVTPATADDVEQTIRRAGDVTHVEIATPAASGLAGSPSAGAGTAASTPSQAGFAAGGARHVRIDVRRLDNLMNLVGELVIARGRLTQIAEQSGDPALEEAVGQSARLITELRDEIMASRMVPVGHVFERFPRVVRDAARATGKEIDFVIDGKEIELDRSMLDEIGDSIVHLLRNAVDHGLETPAERLAAGKPAMGRLSLSAFRDRSAVVIRVSDDGRGIDRARVLARAKRDGLLPEERGEMSDDELLPLIARPGFSTAETVTDLSGRGVGVDAVHTRVRALGGAMNLRTAPGEGTTMTLRLPLTLAIVRALLARVADETYAIPIAHVSETVELTRDIVRTVKGREVLIAREGMLPLLRLRRLVDLPPYEAASEIALEQVVVIDLGDRRAGLVIDELTGQEEIVVKQFDAVRDGLPFFGGATLLGDGTPSLIVDAGSLF
jgi:two-component system chemotaxis sensor kinase CheA